MYRKMLTSAVLVALFLALVGTIGVANGSNLHVLYDRNGNTLITYGGPKVELPSILTASSGQLHPSALESAIVLGSFGRRLWLHRDQSLLRSRRHISHLLVGGYPAVLL